MTVSGRLHVSAALPLGDLLLPMMLGRPRTGQDKLENKKILVHLTEIELRVLGCPARNLVTVQTA